MNYGLQLFSVRDVAEKDFEEALRVASELGFASVEPAGFFGQSGEAVAAMLARYGLTIPSTHTGLRELTEDFDGVVARHKAIGCRDLIFSTSKFKTAAQLDQTIQTALDFRARLEKEGLNLLFHNHSTEFLPNEDGQIFFEELCKRTDLNLELDTFWVYNAGWDPLETMEKYRDRLRYIHLKDGLVRDLSNPESVAKGKALGEGEAPVVAVRKKAMEMGLPIIVESGDLFPTGPEEVARCMAFLKVQDAMDVN
ncbi:MAG: sugar phosphate isomerase/epimerase [Clostridia bacterium]|nr:sugar phosphate isomerase/epimerase [Clostridia bacterium]